MKKIKNKIIANHVGADASGYMRQNNKCKIIGANCVRQNSRGITLIALIITIIVMIILVGVTVNVALNGGLFRSAEKAAYQTDVSVIKEALLERAADLYAKDGDLDSLTSIEDLTLSDDLKNSYGDKLIISGGILYYNTDIVTDEEERTWLEEIDVYPYGGETPGEDTEKAKLNVGDYVAYPSNYITDDEKWERAAFVDRREHGSSVGGSVKGDWGTYNAEISPTNGGWRVLSIDEDTGKITLVSATASTPGNNEDGEVIFKREQVYNNGVEILNRICDTQYTIEGYGKARCMNLEDIVNAIRSDTNTELSNFELSELSYSEINAICPAENTEHDNSYYPARLADEKDVTIDGVTNTNGLSKSQAGDGLYLNNEIIYNYEQGSTETNTGLDLGVTYKKYSDSIQLQYIDTWITETNNAISSLKDDTLKEVILGKDSRTWWIATRSITKGQHWTYNTAYFAMLQMESSSRVVSLYSYGSHSTDGTNACDYLYGNQSGQIAGWFRPVIEIDTSKVINTQKVDQDDDGVIQDGSFEQPWTIIDK